MKYFLDTADQKEINKWEKMVEGVTSNPSILAKCGVTVEDFIKTNVELFENVFVQVRSVEEAETLLESAGVYSDNVIFKVPLLITPEFNGYELLQELQMDGLRTCATIVYDLVQFDYAGDIDAEFSILLHAKNESPYFLVDAEEVKTKQEYDIQTIAASFRSKENVEDAIIAGCDYATVPPKVMEMLFNDVKITQDYNNFYGIN